MLFFAVIFIGCLTANPDPAVLASVAAYPASHSKMGNRDVAVWNLHACAEPRDIALKAGGELTTGPPPCLARTGTLQESRGKPRPQVLSADGPNRFLK